LRSSNEGRQGEVGNYLGQLFSSFFSDLRAHSPVSATGRLVRVLRKPGAAKTSQVLNNSASAKAHQNILGVRDPFFSLSHKHYLANDLTHDERVDAAIRTYGFIDSRLKPEAADAIKGQGLILWSETVNDHTFDLRLMLGNDNIYEGGLSVVFHVDGKRVGVMSFAMADGLLFGASGEQFIWICRNQTTTDRWYQKPLQDAFKQIALPYLMLASLAGLARALDQDKLFAITENAHPHATDEATAKVMSGSYSQFWQKYFAEPAGRGNVKIKIPLETTPLDQVSSNHRRRAKARREIMERVSTETSVAFASALLGKTAIETQGPASVAPDRSRLAASIF
jgi:uncharacterized protein VirK/YbjX